MLSPLGPPSIFKLQNFPVVAANILIPISLLFKSLGLLLFWDPIFLMTHQRSTSPTLSLICLLGTIVTLFANLIH